MHEPNETLPRSLPMEPLKSPGKSLALPPKFLLAILGLILGFALPLYDLVRFALQSELYSYTLLVPFVSVYLFGLNRKNASHFPFVPNRPAAIFLTSAGLGVLGLFWITKSLGTQLVPQDSLSLTTLSFVLLLAGDLCAPAKQAGIPKRPFPSHLPPVHNSVPGRSQACDRDLSPTRFSATRILVVQTRGHSRIPGGHGISTSGNDVTNRAGMQWHPLKPRVVHHQSYRGPPFSAVAVEKNCSLRRSHSIGPVEERFSNLRSR